MNCLVLNLLSFSRLIDVMRARSVSRSAAQLMRMEIYGFVRQLSSEEELEVNQWLQSPLCLKKERSCGSTCLRKLDGGTSSIIEGENNIARSWRNFRGKEKRIQCAASLLLCLHRVMEAVHVLLRARVQFDSI